jgi:hypothetical protein
VIPGSGPGALELIERNPWQCAVVAVVHEACHLGILPGHATACVQRYTDDDVPQPPMNPRSRYYPTKNLRYSIEVFDADDLSHERAGPQVGLSRIDQDHEMAAPSSSARGRASGGQGGARSAGLGLQGQACGIVAPRRPMSCKLLLRRPSRAPSKASSRPTEVIARTGSSSPITHLGSRWLTRCAGGPRSDSRIFRPSGLGKRPLTTGDDCDTVDV